MVSKHFSLKEVTTTNTGINNSIHEEDLPNIQFTAEQMEKVREVLGGYPIRVNSWYRNEQVNRLVGGVPDSAHRRGYAVDFTCAGFGDVTAVCKAIAASGLQYDQLIWEYGSWVHISFSPRMRRQNLWIKSKAQGYQLGVHP